MPARHEITVVILAGGLATRLPRKLELPIDGEPILHRVVRRLSMTDFPCVVSARAPLDLGEANVLACPIIVDEDPGAGPLAALATVAQKVTSPLIFAVAADLPNMSAGFVHRLKACYDAQSRNGEAPAAVIPTRPDGKLEPLAALYNRAAFLTGATAALARGERKVTASLLGLRVCAYPVQPVDEDMFFNINTAMDYERFATRHS